MIFAEFCWSLQDVKFMDAIETIVQLMARVTSFQYEDFMIQILSRCKSV